MSDLDRVIAVMVRDATDADKFRISNLDSFPDATRVRYRRQSDSARNAVAELIAAADEARIDADALGMTTNRLTAALSSCKGEQASRHETNDPLSVSDADVEAATMAYAELAVKYGYSNDVRTVGVDPECIRASLALFASRKNTEGRELAAIAIRDKTADAITGALMMGAHGVDRPPAGHWLTPFWEMANAEANKRIEAQDSTGAHE